MTVAIRPESPADHAAIDRVHREAFDGDEPVEVELVHRLRVCDAWLPPLSLVAETDSGLIGHVCLTRAHVGTEPVLALGPIGVLPSSQGAGVGSELMHAAIDAADRVGEKLIGLLGSLDFYPRFGFVPGSSMGIEPDVAEWTSHFQVRPHAGWPKDRTGTFRYAAPFYAL